VLHRHEDGYVTFSAGAGDDFHHRVAIKAGELETYFPQFMDELLKDSYVSINAGYRLRRHGRIGGQRTRAFGHPKHSTDTLKYLCACYADIDYYRFNADFGSVLGQVVKYQDDGLIPPASIIVRSGRGMWLLWLLSDPKDPERSQGAFPEKIELYTKIQKEIVERLSHLGADPQARDAARHVRVPGSLHTGSERYVEWWIQGAGASGFVYNLTELAQFFGVQVRELNPRVRAAFRDGEQKYKDAARRKGWEALNQRRWRDFERLLALRGGGFDQGCRNHAAVIYAWLLRCNGWSQADGAHQVMEMAANCRPPLSASQCRDAVKTGFGQKMRKMFNQTISDWLTITPSESEMLERLPPATPSQPHRIAVSTPKPERVRGAAAPGRRVTILEIVAKLDGKVPPCREMARLLEEHGIHASHVTISQDYKELDLKTDWVRKRESHADGQRRQQRLKLNEPVMSDHLPGSELGFVK